MHEYSQLHLLNYGQLPGQVGHHFSLIPHPVPFHAADAGQEPAAEIQILSLILAKSEAHFQQES